MIEPFWVLATRRAALTPTVHLFAKTSNTLLVFEYYHWVMAEWSFLTNHARILVFIAHDSDARLRDLAGAAGVTERAAYAIVADLTEAGYIVKEKDGRRNRYHIQAHLPLPDSIIRHPPIGDVLDLLVHAESKRSRPQPTTNN